MTAIPQTDNMKAMTALGAEWWNDSCDPEQLAAAVAAGATGATSNPVIVETAVSSNRDRWLPVVRELAAKAPEASAEDITWELIHEMGRQAAEILRPVHESSGGERGYLSLQVNPENCGDPEAMYQQAVHLAGLAPNIAIKVPTTEPGLIVAERLVGEGTPVNTTVSFSVAQAVAAAEAIERGLTRFAESGGDPRSIHPYVTIMIGRVGDYLGRIADQREIAGLDMDAVTGSGVWVFRRAARIFRERGFQATLLAAAYRHEIHWSDIIGRDVLQSIPYGWWTQFQTATCEVRETIDDPIDDPAVQQLLAWFPEYRLVVDETAMTVAEFEDFEATRATVQQFCEGYRKLVDLVRETLA